MKTFKSRTLPEVYEGPGGVFFVTSEQYVGEARHFWPDTGGITTYMARMGRAEAQATAAAAAAAQDGAAAAAHWAGC